MSVYPPSSFLTSPPEHGEHQRRGDATAPEVGRRRAGVDTDDPGGEMFDASSAMQLACVPAAAKALVAGPSVKPPTSAADSTTVARRPRAMPLILGISFSNP